MKIELHKIQIRDIVNGYVDSQENGVIGYGGKLNIRPAFQREFVYKEKQRKKSQRRNHQRSDGHPDGGLP